MSTYEHPAIKTLCQAIQAIPGRDHAPFDSFVFTALEGLTRGLQHAGGLEAAKLSMELWGNRAPFNGGTITSEHMAAHAWATTAYIDAVTALPPFTDVLGAVYALTLARKGGEGLGQFFTPEDACELQAELTADALERHPWKGRGPFSIHDPASGAGGLLLANLRHLDGPYPVEDVYVNAVDLDPVCCAMTALQLMTQRVVHQRAVGMVRVYCSNALFDPKTWPLFYGHDRVGWAEQWQDVAA